MTFTNLLRNLRFIWDFPMRCAISNLSFLIIVCRKKIICGNHVTQQKK